MSDFSDYREQATLENVRSGGLEVALHIADEGNDPDGSNEVSAESYSSMTVAEGDWSISGSAPTVLENDTTIDFGTAEEDWGAVTHFSLASDDGYETSTVELDNSPHDITSGEDVSIPAGELRLELD